VIIGSDGTPAKSIIDLIEADDDQIAGLFGRLAEKAQAPQAVRDRLVSRICETLTIQRLAEEEVLYPAIRASDDKLVFGFLLVGHGVSLRIGEIRDSGRPRAAREASLARLRDLIRRNLSERQQILLPFARTHLSATQLAWLGDDYLQRKSGLWAVADAARAPRPVALANKPAGARNAISLSLWRQRKARDDLHPQ
jgi:hypothetical protein